MLLAGLAIPIVLLGRLVAVSAPAILFVWTRLMSLANVPFLTWAGVRDGISVALALSVLESPAKPAILAATCAVVLFSIIVQRLTLGAVAHRTIRGADMSPADDRGVGCARRSDASRVM